MTASTINQVIDCIEANDAHGAMDQLVRLLGEQSDMMQLQESGQLRERLQELEEVQTHNLKKIIQGYVSLKDKEQAIVMSNQANQEVNQELMEAGKVLEEKSKQKNVMEKECRALQGQLDQLEEEQQRLQEQRDVVKEETTEIMPKTRYNVGLYGCATKLNWDYTAKPDEVKGYVCSKKDVRPFSLDSKQHSKFFITNYLWDLIEAVAAPQK
ncbi:kinetochore protein spc24-like [Amphiura filiformis]|uniref:kinetochore protein spc24-like n=1 Tax=Amphiura filiformis TaxID=82378 RepID=UPI003B2147D3